MSLNWKEIDRILEELDLPGSHIQQIRQPDYHSLILELYRPGEPFQLYISLAGGSTRLHRLTRKLSNPKTPPRFVEFLRSRIRGGRIIEAGQFGHERIIRLLVKKGDEETILWIRLWGGASNIVVTDTGATVIESFYRRPGRGETAGGHYNPVEEFAQRNNDGSKGTTYELRDITGEGSFNEKIEREYFGKEETAERERLKNQAEQALKQRENRIAFTLEKLKHKRDTYSRFEHYKEYGDLLLSNIHIITKGQKWITVSDFYHDDSRIEIELNPELDPRENAEEYYRRYRKARSGLSIIDDEISQQERALNEIEALLRELQNNGGIESVSSLVHEQKKEARQDKKGKAPGLRYSSSGFTIMVGRTARENDELLRRHVRGNDLWLHVRDYSGSYVFIKSKAGKSIPLDVLLNAGNLALFYSKGRNSAQGDLYYTQAKYLRRARDGKTGLVLPTQEKNLHIRLDSARLEKLQNGNNHG